MRTRIGDSRGMFRLSISAASAAGKGFKARALTCDRSSVSQPPSATANAKAIEAADSRASRWKRCNALVPYLPDSCPVPGSSEAVSSPSRSYESTPKMWSKQGRHRWPTAQKNMLNNLQIHGIGTRGPRLIAEAGKSNPLATLACMRNAIGKAKTAVLILTDSACLRHYTPDRQKFVLTMRADSVPIHVEQRSQCCRHGLSHGLDGRFWVAVSAAPGLADDFVDHSESHQILSGNLHAGGRFLGFRGIAPQNRCSPFRRDHAVDRVLKHQDPIGGRDCDGAT